MPVSKTYFGALIGRNSNRIENAECIINQEKSVLDLEPTDDFFFKDEVKSIIKRYHGKKTDKMLDAELDLIVDEFRKE